EVLTGQGGVGRRGLDPVQLPALVAGAAQEEPTMGADIEQPARRFERPQARQMLLVAAVTVVGAEPGKDGAVFAQGRPFVAPVVLLGLAQPGADIDQAALRALHDPQGPLLAQLDRRGGLAKRAVDGFYLLSCVRRFPSPHHCAPPSANTLVSRVWVPTNLPGGAPAA